MARPMEADWELRGPLEKAALNALVEEDEDDAVTARVQPAVGGARVLTSPG